MYQLKEIQLVVNYYNDVYDPVKLELPSNSVIVKISYWYTDYQSNLHLFCLYKTVSSKEIDKYELRLFKNDQDISDSFIYLNSFENNNKHKYHVCYRKE